MSPRWFDQRQIEALVTGKEVLEKEGDKTSSENNQQHQQHQQQNDNAAGGDNKEGEEDMGPLLKGVPDSPDNPPTDLNSFLESV